LNITFTQLAEYLKLPKFLLAEIETLPKQEQDMIFTTIRNAIVDDLEVLISQLKYSNERSYSIVH
jgi:hypothetical protein